MRIFNGNIQKIENAVIDDYIDPFSIPNLKILVSNGRDFLNTPSTEAKYTLRNHTNLGDGLGYPLYTQNNGLLKSNGFKVGVAGSAETSVSWGGLDPNPSAIDSSVYEISFFSHIKVSSALPFSQKIWDNYFLQGNGSEFTRIRLTQENSLLRISIYFNDSLQYLDYLFTPPTGEFTVALTAQSNLYKFYVNAVLQQTSTVTGTLMDNKRTKVALSSSLNSTGEYIHGSFLMCRSILSEKTIKQLDNKILNLGYL